MDPTKQSPLPPPPYQWPNFQQAAENHKFYDSLLTEEQREEKKRQLAALIKHLNDVGAKAHMKNPALP